MLGQITDALEQELVLELVGSPFGLRILDVGCGDGILALELARRGAYVTGVDASERMIVAGRQRAKRQGCNVIFETAEAEALPFASGTFDVVVAITLLCFIEDTAAALRDMARVLRPSGRLIVGELGKWNSWAAVRRVMGWFGSPIWTHAHFKNVSELRKLMAEAGFSEISVTGAIFYPPIGVAARLFRPIDHRIGTYTTFGAAFLALTGCNSGQPVRCGDGVEGVD